MTFAGIVRLLVGSFVRGLGFAAKETHSGRFFSLAVAADQTYSDGSQYLDSVDKSVEEVVAVPE